MIVVFSLIAFSLVGKFLMEVKKFQKKVKGDALTDCCIELYGLPLDGKLEVLEQEIKKVLVEKFSSAVADVIVVPNLSEAYKYFLAIESHSYSLQHFKAMNEAKGVPQKVATSCLCCKKVDAMEFHTEKRTTAIKDFLKVRAETAESSTEIAFVICTS
jgi:ribosome-binding factor A